jgi:hypothetical protein
MKTNKLKLLYFFTKIKLFFAEYFPWLWSSEFISRRYFDLCSFRGECDFCKNPKGSTFCDISSGEGYIETNFHICSSCAPKKIVTIQLEGMHYALKSAEKIKNEWSKNNLKW